MGAAPEFEGRVGPFLADDLLEGRGTGSRGHEIAALYVASTLAGALAAGAALAGVPVAPDAAGLESRRSLRTASANWR